MPNGIGFYCIFLTEEINHDLEYFQSFLTQLMPIKIEKFFHDDTYYKKKYESIIIDNTIHIH